MDEIIRTLESSLQRSKDLCEHISEGLSPHSDACIEMIVLHDVERQCSAIPGDAFIPHATRWIGDAEQTCVFVYIWSL